MAGTFRPQVSVVTSGSLTDYNRGYSKRKDLVEVYPTYAKLKTQIKRYLKESVDNELTVIRHRRGEWGEWFEKWRMTGDNKLVIFDKGWM